MPDNNVFQQNAQPQQGQTKPEIPQELVALPSLGKVYGMDHPLYNAESVEIRCMCARDEDILTSRALIKNGTVLTQLMKSVLMNKLIDPDSLLTGDRNAILISTRITGYGPEYGAKISCPLCSEEFDAEFKLENLKIKSLGAEPAQPNSNIFSFVLPKSKWSVNFKLLTGRDELELSKEGDKKKKLGISQESGITSRMFKSIISINGESDPNKLKHFIDVMPAGDARELRRYINKIEPDVLMLQTVVCKNCSESVEVDVPIGINFFWGDV